MGEGTTNYDKTQRGMIARNLRRIADSIESADGGKFEFNLSGDRKIQYPDGSQALESEVYAYPPDSRGAPKVVSSSGELHFKYEIPVHE